MSYIVCIDHKDISPDNQIKDKWRKRWLEVDMVQRVMLWSEFENDPLSDCTLVLIHRSAMSYDDEEYRKQVYVVEQKLKGPNTICVGVVSAGSSLKHSISHEGRFCILQTPFGIELSELANRIHVLFSEINEAYPDAEKLHRAWENFDKAGECSEFTLSLSLLCQGYLAQYALTNKANGGVNINGCCDVGKALYAMGWVEDESAKKVSQAVNKLELDSEEPLQDIKFWTDPFEGGKSIRSGIQCELPKSLPKIPDGVEDLVQAIEGKNISDSHFVSLVSRAFLDLSQLLKAA